MALNQIQKTIIVIAVLCITAMAIYPPWVLGNITDMPPGKIAGPYRFIWSPPSQESVGGYFFGIACFIDLYRLSVQFVAVLVVTIGLCLVCSTPKE